MKEQATSLISEVKPNITSDHDGNKIQIKALFIDGLPETNPKPKIKVQSKMQSMNKADALSPKKTKQNTKLPQDDTLTSSVQPSIKADEKNMTSASGFIDKKMLQYK